MQRELLSAKLKKILMCVLSFALIVILTGIIQIVTEEFSNYLKNIQIFSNFITFFVFCASILKYVCAIIILRICCGNNKSSFSEQISFYPDKQKTGKYISLFFIGFGFAVITPYIITWLFSLFPAGSGMIEAYAEQTNAALGGDSLAASLAVIVLAAPIAEEIIFRGFMLNYLKSSFSPCFSIVFISLFFALSHGSAVQIAYAFIMGVILTYFAFKFNNIIYSAMIHFGFNFTVITTLLINNNKNLYDFIGTGLGTAVYFFAGALIVAASAFGFLSKGERTYERHT